MTIWPATPATWLCGVLILLALPVAVWMARAARVQRRRQGDDDDGTN